MRSLVAACFCFSFLLVAGQCFAKEASKVESCVAGMKTYTFHLPDPDVDTRKLNSLLAQYLRKDPGFDTPWNEKNAIPAQADVVKLEFERVACGAATNGRIGQVDAGASAVGGCSQVGCVGNLPLEFTGNPGDTVSITTCSASTGVQETGSFEMNSQGLWIMTSHNEIRVTSCEITP